VIDPHRFWLFLIAALLLSLSPGPGMLYVLARTLHGGRAEGLASSLGTAVGGLVHVVAATLGLSAILMSSALAYGVLKYAGAAYLIYLGCRMVFSARSAEPAAPAAGPAPQNSFRQGILTEALNPKTAVFFFSFLPQFVTPSGPVALQFLFLGCVSVVLNSLVDVAVVLFSAPLARAFATHPRLRRTQEAGSGCALIGLGAYVAVSGEK
jgi:threonine/homoserine/homoserine lactone efflux protein